ncbi:DUF3566 domain-containing protein, partial [Dietzia sp. DQ12-76]|nr:DUF3566 domain-containing protein [Dietzia sp. DQ12-76]
MTESSDGPGSGPAPKGSTPAPGFGGSAGYPTGSEAPVGETAPDDAGATAS